MVVGDDNRLVSDCQTMRVFEIPSNLGNACIFRQEFPMPHHDQSFVARQGSPRQRRDSFQARLSPRQATLPSAASILKDWLIDDGPFRPNYSTSTTTIPSGYSPL